MRKWSSGCRSSWPSACSCRSRSAVSSVRCRRSARAALASFRSASMSAKGSSRRGSRARGSPWRGGCVRSTSCPRFLPSTGGLVLALNDLLLVTHRQLNRSFCPRSAAAAAVDGGADDRSRGCARHPGRGARAAHHVRAHLRAGAPRRARRLVERAAGAISVRARRRAWRPGRDCAASNSAGKRWRWSSSGRPSPGPDAGSKPWRAGSEPRR